MKKNLLSIIIFSFTLVKVQESIKYLNKDTNIDWTKKQSIHDGMSTTNNSPLLITLPTFSQNKTKDQLKAEKNFVKVIREIAYKYPTNYSTDEGSTLTKPHVIQITNKDELQMEWDFKDADTVVKITRTIKISDISSVYLDYNMGFYSEDNKVEVNYNNKYNEERPNYSYNYHLFEIAKVGDGKQGKAIKLKLEKALADLVLFYKKE